MRRSSKAAMLALLPCMAALWFVWPRQQPHDIKPHDIKPRTEADRQVKWISMALNSAGYTAAGAGYGAVNGNYVPVTGANATNNGAQVYFNGAIYLYWTGTSWGTGSTQPTGSTNGTGNSYYSQQTGSTTAFPLTGWGVNASPGTGNPPTFTANAIAPTTSPPLTASAGAGGNTVNYTNGIPGGYGQRIYRNTSNSNSGGTKIFDVGSTAGNGSQPAGSYTDNTAPIGTPVYYYGTYYNSAGEGPAGAVAGPVSANSTQGTGSTVGGTASNIATAQPNAKPGAPVNLVATAGNATVGLVWTNPAALSSITVQRRVSVASGPVNAWATLATLTAATAGQPATVPSSYQDSDPALVNGTYYDYQVVANP